MAEVPRMQAKMIDAVEYALSFLVHLVAGLEER